MWRVDSSNAFHDHDRSSRHVQIQLIRCELLDDRCNIQSGIRGARRQIFGELIVVESPCSHRHYRYSLNVASRTGQCVIRLIHPDRSLAVPLHLPSANEHIARGWLAANGNQNRTGETDGEDELPEHLTRKR